MPRAAWPWGSASSTMLQSLPGLRSRCVAESTAVLLCSMAEQHCNILQPWSPPTHLTCGASNLRTHRSTCCNTHRHCRRRGRSVCWFWTGTYTTATALRWGGLGGFGFDMSMHGCIPHWLSKRGLWSIGVSASKAPALVRPARLTARPSTPLCTLACNHWQHTHTQRCRPPLLNAHAQHIFEDDPSVLYMSLHRHDKWVGRWWCWLGWGRQLASCCGRQLAPRGRRRARVRGWRRLLHWGHAALHDFGSGCVPLCEQQHLDLRSMGGPHPLCSSCCIAA